MHFVSPAAACLGSGMTPGQFYRDPYLRMNRVWATRPLVLQSVFERRRGPAVERRAPFKFGSVPVRVSFRLGTSKFP